MKSVEMGQCVEIYCKDDMMIYINKEDENKYIYGYYNGPKQNEEWTATSIDFYPSIMKISFETDTIYTETREFNIIDITKIYIGNEWSN